MALFAVVALVGCLVATPAASAKGPSYIVVDHITGTILASSEADQKRPVASLTKVAMAMVVLDWAERGKHAVSEVMTVPPQALQLVGPNPMGLQVGDQLTLRDLLYAALLQSDNLAAETLAYNVGLSLQRSGIEAGVPPVEAFVTQMNELAGSLEMRRTLFRNPHGLDSGYRTVPYSTAADMARLTRYAMNDAAFRFYVTQRKRKIQIVRAGQQMEYELSNTNELLLQNGIDGVKTGLTSLAGECLILSSARPDEARQQGEQFLVTPRRLDVVLLGGRDRFGMGAGLVQSGWQRYDAWASLGRPSEGYSTLATPP